MKRIYLDHAAATPIRDEVLIAMQPYHQAHFGNASSLNQEGREAREAIEDARKTVANFLNSAADEIIFTGSGTESCNLAVTGTAFGREEMGKHIVVSAVEHHAVLNTAEALRHEGYEITIVPVDENGKVDAAELAGAVRNDTILVSVIFANNEIGTINDLKKITRAVKQENSETYVHTDACQAPGYLKLDVRSLGVDLLTVNGAKANGPKGVGALYIKRGTKMFPATMGGGQERGLRSGTENVASIVGMAKALELAANELDQAEKVAELRDSLEKGLLEKLPSIKVNGADRLPNNLNISIPGVEGEAVVIYLDEAGIAASTGSACSTVHAGPSHVLKALGHTDEMALGSVRFSLGRKTSQSDIDKVIEVLPGIVNKLRE